VKNPPLHTVVRVQYPNSYVITGFSWRSFFYNFTHSLVHDRASEVFPKFIHLNKLSSSRLGRSSCRTAGVLEVVFIMAATFIRSYSRSRIFAKCARLFCYRLRVDDGPSVIHPMALMLAEKKPINFQSELTKRAKSL